MSSVDAISRPFDWIGGDGTPYRAMTFTGPGYHNVRVSVRRGSRSVATHLVTVSLDPDSNTVVGFDEWRAEHTGFDYTANPYPAWEKRYPDGHPSAGAGLSEHARHHETARLEWPSRACTHCPGAWTTGSNRPGYLPETDVHAFAEWADAAEYLRTAMREWADDVDEQARENGQEDDTRADVDAVLSVDGFGTWTPGTDYTAVVTDPDGHGMAWWIQWSPDATPDTED